MVFALRIARIKVDVERGRTVKGWKPRRLGGGLGGRGYTKAMPSRPHGRARCIWWWIPRRIWVAGSEDVIEDLEAAAVAVVTLATVVSAAAVSIAAVTAASALPMAVTTRHPTPRTALEAVGTAAVTVGTIRAPAVATAARAVVGHMTTDLAVEAAAAAVRRRWRRYRDRNPRQTGSNMEPIRPRESGGYHGSSGSGSGRDYDRPRDGDDPSRKRQYEGGGYEESRKLRRY